MLVVECARRRCMVMCRLTERCQGCGGRHWQVAGGPATMALLRALRRSGYCSVICFRTPLTVSSTAGALGHGKAGHAARGRAGMGQLVTCRGATCQRGLQAQQAA